MTSTQLFIASVVVFNFVVTGSYYVNQTGLKLTDTTQTHRHQAASASPVLGLKCATILSPTQLLDFIDQADHVLLFRASQQGYDQDPRQGGWKN